MVHECQYIYETGRKCRRIPKRGETLCAGHRPDAVRRRSLHEQPDFTRQLSALAEQLSALDLTTLLGILLDSFAAISNILERDATRPAYTAFARANIALSIAIRRLSESPSPQHPRFVPCQPVARPMPDNTFPFDPGRYATPHGPTVPHPSQNKINRS
jgi:hypothetical protein